jgi:hypothetical protein
LVSLAWFFLICEDDSLEFISLLMTARRELQAARIQIKKTGQPVFLISTEMIN